MTPLGQTHQVTQILDKQIYNEENVSSQKSIKIENNEKIYKLIIQIDKIKTRPGPKSKKKKLLKISTTKAIAKINENIKNKIKLLNNIKSNDNNLLSNNLNCKLNSNQINTNNNQQEICTFCNNSFTTKQQLIDHIKMIHYYCYICSLPCDNKESYDNHQKIHYNKDPLLPFKCHICTSTFNCEEAVKLHNEQCHINGLSIDQKNIKIKTEEIQKPTNLTSINAYIRYQCQVCKAILKENTPCRDHIISYPQNRDFTFAIPVRGWKNRKSKGSLQFNNQSMSRANDHKISFKMCQLCKQYIKSSEMDKHIAQHISRAYPCLLCTKLFINNESLQNHVKTHLKIDPQ